MFGLTTVTAHTIMEATYKSEKWEKYGNQYTPKDQVAQAYGIAAWKQRWGPSAENECALYNAEKCRNFLRQTNAQQGYCHIERVRLWDFFNHAEPWQGILHRGAKFFPAGIKNPDWCGSGGFLYNRIQNGELDPKDCGTGKCPPCGAIAGWDGLLQFPET